MDAKESTRPFIEFPLGLALLLIVLFSMSILCACCIHWNKLRSLLGFSSDSNSHVPEVTDQEHSPQKSSPPHISMENQAQSLPVLMPGDQVPKFMATACPSEPSTPRFEKIIAETQKLSPN